MNNVVRRLGKDEKGASLIEYTVLLGILLVAVIATIGAVGDDPAGSALLTDQTAYPGRVTV
jgi:Flp pilus assembly pilin Flp